MASLAPATTQSDEQYLDFVEGLRVFNQKQVQSRFRERFAQAETEFRSAHGRAPETIDDAHAMLDGVPLFASRSRIWRSSQTMMWQQIVETYRAREPELLAELDRADRSGPGSVQWDPSFIYPQYVDDHEIHVQPGSYHRDPLAGYIYHYGTKIFFTPYIGNQDDDDNQRQMVLGMPLPADGVVRRVLDIGCSIGQSTTAWKERLPQAEVFGIDIAAPMVRYSHKRAVELGSDVHFRQMPAERLAFPDASFDVVYSYILFHELPVESARAALRDAARVLRPGGIFLVNDFVGRTDSLLDTYMLDFITKHNGEPFAWDFCHLDFHAELRAAGFRFVREEVVGSPAVDLATNQPKASGRTVTLAVR